MKLALKAVPLAVIAMTGGCEARGNQLPLLTKEAFFAAAKKCGAQDFEFKFSLDGRLPSFSYLDPGPFESGKATPTSICLADSLKGYRYESMEIRTRPRAATGA